MESMTASLRTAVMKTSSGSSLEELQESGQTKRKVKRREGAPPDVPERALRWLTSFTDV